MAKASGQGAIVLQPGEVVRWNELGPEAWFLIPLLD
jgi:hypothetical protein